MIGSGLHAYFFVREFKGTDANDFSPTVSCMLGPLGLYNKKYRKQIFVALVLLLGKLKVSIGDMQRSNQILNNRRESKDDISRNIFSELRQSNHSPEEGSSEDHAKVPRVSPHEAEVNERLAMAAVPKLCPTTRSLL